MKGKYNLISSPGFKFDLISTFSISLIGIGIIIRVWMDDGAVECYSLPFYIQQE